MFALMPSMITGNPELDAEHRELVDIINTLAEAERHHQSGDAMAALKCFRQELETHFQREEGYFDIIGFPGKAAHVAHHAETLQRLQEIMADFDVHTAQPGGAATVCFDELLRTVLLQDLQVVNWLADRAFRST